VALYYLEKGASKRLVPGDDEGKREKGRPCFKRKKREPVSGKEVLAQSGLIDIYGGEKKRK